MTITIDLIEAFLKCPTKCYLRSRGEIGAGNAFADWARAKRDSFRGEAIRRLVAEVAPDKCVANTSAIESLRQTQWQLAVDLTARIQNLQCSCHTVERMPSGGRGRAAQYVPIRFVLSNKLTRDDKLLLALNALVLSEMLRREVGLGKIVYGDNYSTQKVKTSALVSDVRKLIEKIGVLLASSSPPDLVLNRHCVECEFQARCRQKAIEKDDLSLLGGMTEKERSDFSAKGIFTVTQLSYTFRPRRRPNGLKDKRERYHSSLRALAIREKKIYIVGTPELKIHGTPVYLDVEGLPDRDFYYLIGVRIIAGDSVVHHSLWADRSSDECRIWQELLSELMKIENPVLIHYGSFETVFLKRMCERHGGPPNGSGAAKALESSVNLLAVIFGQIYFPTYSNGLKEIASWLRFKWSDQNASGIQSIIWRDEWEQTKSALVKEKLINYNCEDCAALELAARAVAHVSQQSIGSNSEAAERLEVVVADNLDSKVTLWPKFSSSIEGFEVINEAARWDYQRDSVLHQSRRGVEAGQAEEGRPRKNEHAHQQGSGLRTIARVPTLPKKGNTDVSENNEAPPRSEVQQVRPHWMDSGVSVSSFLVPNLPGIHPLAEGILGSYHV